MKYKIKAGDEFEVEIENESEIDRDIKIKTKDIKIEIKRNDPLWKKVIDFKILTLLAVIYAGIYGIKTNDYTIFNNLSQILNNAVGTSAKGSKSENTS